MDALEITGLHVSTTIGVHAWEQRIKQRLAIDITIPIDFSGCQDDLTHTIDYAALCQKVTAYVEENQFALIETVANNVAQLIKEHFAVNQLTVRVHKPHAVPNTQDIAVIAHR